MLYVSRVTDDGYYITDTTDGIEEVVDKSQLLEIIRLGLNVQGVSVYNGKVSIRACSPEGILASIRLGVSNDFIIKLVDNEIALVRCIGNKDSIIVPSGVTRILNNNSLERTRGIRSIQIPDTVTRLGDMNFYNHKILESVQLPRIIKCLDGRFTFNSCENLKSIIIPDGVTDLKDLCFFSCKNLRSIVIPNSVKSIGNNCFIDCSSLEHVQIPDSVISLGEKCFLNCTSLKSIQLSSSIIRLGRSCFQNCGSLEFIEIPNSVVGLGEKCFAYCKSLAYIEIPSSVQSIGDRCFSGCKGLRCIKAPIRLKSELDRFSLPASCVIKYY